MRRADVVNRIDGRRSLGASVPARGLSALAHVTVATILGWEVCRDTITRGAPEGGGGAGARKPSRCDDGRRTTAAAVVRLRR